MHRGVTLATKHAQRSCIYKCVQRTRARVRARTRFCVCAHVFGRTGIIAGGAEQLGDEEAVRQPPQPKEAKCE